MSCVRLTRKVKVINDMGIHTRPAACIVQLLQNSKCEVSLTYRKETVNARSILNILMLAIHKNATVTFDVEGEELDAISTMEKLVLVFEKGFEEVSTHKK